MSKRKTKADYFTKPKLMVANVKDITTSYVQNCAKLGYVTVIILIPDEQAHGEGSSQNVSIYGCVPDTEMQVKIMREVADKIELSEEGLQKEVMPRTDN